MRAKYLAVLFYFTFLPLVAGTSCPPGADTCPEPQEENNPEDVSVLLMSKVEVLTHKDKATTETAIPASANNVAESLAETAQGSNSIDEEEDEDEEEEEVPAGNETQSEDTSFDDLPQAVLASEREKRKVTSEQKEAGMEFLEGKYGALGTLFINAGVELARYHARVINKAGQLKQSYNSTGHMVYEEPKKDNMTAILKEWRAELLKFTSATKCPEDPLDMEACMQETRCLLEPEVGKTIPAPFFATFMELEDTLNACLKNFEVSLGAPSDTVMYLCAGELGNEDGDAEKEGAPHVQVLQPEMFMQEPYTAGSSPKPNEHAHRGMTRLMPNEHNMASILQRFEASSDRQQRAVAAVATIQHAADLTEQMAATSTARDEWEGIWHPACTVLGCDHNSYVDILHTMHGHAAELVEVEAPAAAIRIYVRAMRKAQRTQMKWIGRAASLNEEFRDGIRMPAKHAVASKRYSLMLKKLGGMLDGAYMGLKGSSVQLTAFWHCWGSIAFLMMGYGVKHPPGLWPPVGVILTFGVPGRGQGPGPLENVMNGIGSETLSGQGREYNGGADRTRLGYTCQKWSEQSPHKHGLLTTLARNYCRNPDGENTIWCYTTSSARRWDYCDPKPADCSGISVSLRVGIFIGLTLGLPETPGFASGLSAGTALKFKPCNPGRKLRHIRMGTSGQVTWPGTSCPFGPVLGGFKCAESARSGLTFFCCTIDLLTGDNDC